MASAYEINQVEPAQSDTENEYEMIRDDESIEILDEPGDGTDDFLGISASFSSGEQDDTEGANSRGSGAKTEQPTGDSDVRTDSKKYEGTDTSSAESDNAIVREAFKLTGNQEKDTHENQTEGNKDVENQEQDEGRGQNRLEDSETSNGTYSRKYEMIMDEESIGILRVENNNSLHFSATFSSSEQEDDSSNRQTKIGKPTSGKSTDLAIIDGTDTATGEGSEDNAEEVVESLDNQGKDVCENQIILSIASEIQAMKLDPQLDTMQSDAAIARSTDAQDQDKKENKFESENAARQIIFGIVDKLDDNQEAMKLDPQLETIQSDSGTKRSTDAQKDKAEDTKLLNKHSATAISVTIKVPKCLDEIAIFRSDQQHIKKKAPICKRIDQLGFSARLFYYNLDIKLHNEGCLMTADDNFLAKVRILDSKLVDQTVDFNKAKKVLLQQLRIVNVLQDDLMTEKITQEKSVLKAIETTLKNSLGNGKPEVDPIELTYIINTHYGKLDFGKLCEKIKYNQLMSQKLRRTAELYLLADSRCITRGNMLARFGHRQPVTNSSDLIAQLKTMLCEHGEAYRKQLLEKAPTCLNATLSSISNDRIMFVQSSDIKLFSDMVGVLDEKMFQKPLADLAARWTDFVGKTKIKNLSIEPQTSPIFYFLAKSLEDLIVEITNRTDHTAEDLLISNNSGWHPIKTITWKSENVLTQCIEREYFFIFKLLKHFDLGTRNEKKPFAYDVKMLEGSNHQSTWWKLVKDTKKFFGYAKASGNSLQISDEKYVWYCLLDDVLYHILPAEYQLDSFDQTLQAYIDFLNKAGREQLETLRVMTHNTARFIVQTMPYVVQKDSSSIDGQILQKQLDLINTKSIQYSLTSNSFRDLVDVFKTYWKNREDFIAVIAFKIPLPEITTLTTTLLEIVSLALEKNVSSEAVVSFFRAYSDLLTDLNDVQFDWYIKPYPGVRMGPLVELELIKLIDNKWTNTDNRIYSVEAAEKFAKAVPVLFEKYSCPKHYVLEILLTLISYIKNQLQKTTWNSGDQLCDMVQISTTNELIFAVRNSFLYLKEQPEYVSFELFFDERIKPFASAIANSSSHRDFTNRIYLIKESFWYIRKQNEMDIDKALELFSDLNAGFETEVLRSVYQKYADSFQQFLEMCCDVSEHVAKATHIANKVKEITFVESHQTWTNKDKLEKIPEILAGLAAVWSVLVSKDVSSTGKYLTPHCIQILCILRLLGVDRAENGVVSHLSQILTGQGKSLVLGLTATLLALTGHNPRIVCYNEYLVERDRQDFKHFISMFDLSDSVIYSTFEDMANDLIAPVVNGERMGLRSLVKQLILGDEQPNKNELIAEDMRKSILLIDEVDVFFTSKLYGDEYRAGDKLMLPGLDLIQQEIWSIVSQRGCRIVDEIIKEIDSFINSEKMIKEEKFHKFIANEKHYKILVRRDGKVDSKSYTNKQLFDDQLEEMIRCALKVSIGESIGDYILSSEGAILYNDYGKFVNNTWITYYQVFNYFRLRGSNFCTKVGNETNYGYFNISSGSISYAILPKSYPLILGVSGTLADLNQYEKQSIKNLYNINEMSLMPTYFGVSNLSFDQSHSFRVLDSVSEWKTEIFARVNAILGAHRSVLVFFESDLLLNRFHAEYCSQFDRLNVLTENTEPELMNQYIEEAGVAKTITLATSAMGRGVDYKSSVAIEKHGGLHVIQTFFSLDVKEETQIKGRTARKDNHGSYELKICKEHLHSGTFSGHNLAYRSLHEARLALALKDNLTYRSLHEARLARALKDNKQILKSINDCQQNHDTTMTYMKSFFKR